VIRSRCALRLVLLAVILTVLIGALATPAGALTTAAPEGIPCLPVVGCDPAGRLAGDAAQVAAQGVLDASAHWVAAGATALLTRVIIVMTATTSVDLENPKGASNWFSQRFAWMRTLAAFVILPMLLVAGISAVVHQDPARLLRAVAVYLPLAVLGTAVAIELTNRALQLTDLLSNQVSSSLGGNVQQSLDGVIRAMEDLTGTGSAAGGFIVMVGMLLVAFGALLVWIELLVRASAIYVAVLFLPLVLSGLLWPSTARWARRMVELLVALVLSKFIIVAVISLAAGALAGGDSLDAVLAGAALMLMAAFAPFVLLRLVPIAEAGVIGQLEGLERRPVAAARGAASRAVGAATGGSSGGGFTSTAAGFSTDSGMSMALGAILPDPADSDSNDQGPDGIGGHGADWSGGTNSAAPDQAALPSPRPSSNEGDWTGDDSFDGGWD
jgi:type IV secretion system protein TrbL